jgi:hypothetical protein
MSGGGVLRHFVETNTAVAWRHIPWQDARFIRSLSDLQCVT